MHHTRREVLGALLAAAPAVLAAPAGAVTRYVRFRHGATTAYGILDGERVRELRGDLFAGAKETGAVHKLVDVKMLCPCRPPKVLAVGVNYRSHLGNTKPPEHPEIFYKPVSALQNPGDPIRLPKDSTNVHYEGELVLVIGKPVRNASLEEARTAIFGVTCGNDVSEREWQNGPRKDMQWWRAKGADTFAPLGPVIARGLDYGKLLLQTRLNGQVVQKQSTSDLIFDAPAIVSFISHYVTLAAGDVIYTGTPGHTAKMKPGDVVEVEIEGIGILRNPVQAA
jgi:2-keto-4-pentenoate hydratase/2-oxohepta-3-ene-1,7-dioic acid hydratase in catechol pathway